VLVRFEEGKLLKKALPGHLVVLLLFHNVFGYLHGLFQLCDHDVSGCQTHVVGRVHAWESRGDDWEEVILFIRLIEQRLVDVKLHHFGIGFDLA